MKQQEFNMMDVLGPLGVYHISEDREAKEHGVLSVRFVVQQEGYMPHVFHFAKGNHMSKEDMTSVMASYLRKNL